MFSLIQQGKIVSPAIDGPLSRAVNLDKMRADELSYAARQASLAELNAAATAGLVRFVRFPTVCNKGGKVLYAYGPFAAESTRDYAQNLEAYLSEEQSPVEWITLGEAAGRIALPFYIRTDDEVGQYTSDLATQFWWDIEAGVFMSFDREFMARLPRILNLTWSVMDHVRPVELSATLNDVEDRLAIHASLFAIQHSPRYS